MNLTKYGTNKEPILSIASPTPSVAKKLLKGEKKIMKRSIGKPVSDTKINLPGIVISCSTPQLSHLTGLYTQPKNAL
ncbi:hypothetical protein MKX62_15070 [Sporosarcina sp. FSL K6-5500]